MMDAKRIAEIAREFCADKWDARVCESAIRAALREFGDELAKVADTSTPRHSECGGKIAHAIRSKVSALTGESHDPA